MTKYPPEYTKLQHLKIFSGSMFDLAFSPHRGLEDKGSNPLLALGQSNSKLVWDLCKVNYNFSKWKLIAKFRETVRKGECPEDVYKLLVSLIAVNECACIHVYIRVCVYAAIKIMNLLFFYTSIKLCHYFILFYVVNFFYYFS